MRARVWLCVCVSRMRVERQTPTAERQQSVSKMNHLAPFDEWYEEIKRMRSQCAAHAHTDTQTPTLTHTHNTIVNIYMCMRLFWIPDTRFNSKIFIFIIQPRRSSLRCDGARFTAATNSALRAAAITVAAHALVVFCCRSAAASQRRRSKYFVSHTA